MILSAALLMLYPVAIQVKRGGAWRLLAPLTALAFVLDVVANYTEWAFCFGWPRESDYTISKRLRTMQATADPARAEFAHAVQVYLDAFEPDGKH